MGGCGVWPVSAMSRAKRIVETAMVAAAIGLLVTGLLKVLDIVMGTVKPRANVVFPFIDDDVLFPLTGLLEVVVAVYVLLSRGAHPVRSLASLAWIGSLFLLYRVGLAVYGEGAQRSTTEKNHPPKDRHPTTPGKQLAQRNPPPTNKPEPP